MFDTFTRLVTDASGWTYGIIALFALLDAVLPVVPSEATVITAGVVCSTGHLNLSRPYHRGCRCLARRQPRLRHRTAVRRAGQGPVLRWRQGRQRVAWAERQLGERGNELIVVGRFIPAGRTLITLTAGTLAYPWRRFALFDAVAAVIWALYAGLLGYFGGKAFEDAPWKGLLLAFGLALAVTGGIELFRWLRRRRRAAAGR